jgi:hypothetical protein
MAGHCQLFLPSVRRGGDGITPVSLFLLFLRNVLMIIVDIHQLRTCVQQLPAALIH